MNRLQLALHVLRGKPLVYRATFIGPFKIAPTKDLWSIENLSLPAKDSLG